MCINPSFVTMLEGRNATRDDLTLLSFAGFAHFTAMQVREGKVRGLDLHLKRLHQASMEMFGKARSDIEIQTQLRAAISTSGPPSLSLTATAFSRNGEFTPFGTNDDPALLIKTFPSSSGPAGPLKLDIVRHQRPLAHLKHVAETAKTLFLRHATENGFDDAIFIDAQNRIAEATIWNIAFWDGRSVVWPKADMLKGITMQIIDRNLSRLGYRSRSQDIRLGDIKKFYGAALMNSWTPGIAVYSIGMQDIPPSEEFTAILHAAYHAESLEAI